MSNDDDMSPARFWICDSINCMLRAVDKFYFDVGGAYEKQRKGHGI